MAAALQNVAPVQQLILLALNRTGIKNENQNLVLNECLKFYDEIISKGIGQERAEAETMLKAYQRACEMLQHCERQLHDCSEKVENIPPKIMRHETSFTLELSEDEISADLHVANESTSSYISNFEYLKILKSTSSLWREGEKILMGEKELSNSMLICLDGNEPTSANDSLDTDLGRNEPDKNVSFNAAQPVSTSIKEGMPNLIGTVNRNVDCEVPNSAALELCNNRKKVRFSIPSEGLNDIEDQIEVESKEASSNQSVEKITSDLSKRCLISDNSKPENFDQLDLFGEVELSDRKFSTENGPLDANIDSQTAFLKLAKTRRNSFFVKPKVESSPDRKKKNLTKKKQSCKKGEESYVPHIYKLLKQRHLDIGVSSKSMSILNSMENDIFERIAQEASQLVEINGKTTMTSHEIKTAVQLLFPSCLASRAILSGDRALQIYRESENSDQDASEVK